MPPVRRRRQGRTPKGRRVTEPEPLHDADAEQVVLGALMIAPTVADDVLEIITTADFYQPSHATIYAHLVANHAAGNPVDPVATAHSLDTAGELQRIGGVTYLHTLVAAVPTVANASWYARIIANHAIRRRIITAATGICHDAAQLERDVPDVANRSQQAILEATAPRQRSQVTTLAALVDDETEPLLDPDAPRRGLTTGLGSLDEIIGGLKPGQLVIVAGRPGTGKSVLCVDIARANIRRDVPVLLMSLEMHRSEILARIYAAEAEVSLYRLLNGGLDDHERARVRYTTGRLRPLPMHIDTTRSCDLGVIRSAARKLKARHGLGLLVVDYLQLMTPTGRHERRDLELGEISRGLKLLAGDLDIPIVAAAQLNRAAEARPGKLPQLSDLRESGSFEQDADIAVLLHRPDYHDQENPRAGEIDLIVAKNRNGPQGTVTAAAQLQYARFVDMRILPRPASR
jgi:replicative DNA helicase